MRTFGLVLMLAGVATLMALVVIVMSRALRMWVMTIVPAFAVVAIALVATAIASSKLLPDHPVLYWMAVSGIWAFYVLSLTFSFRVITPGNRKAVFWLGGSYVGTFASQSDYNITRKSYEENGMLVEFEGNCFARNILFLQFPFFLVVDVTSQVVKFVVEATDSVWTVAENNAPRAEMTIKVELTFVPGVRADLLANRVPRNVLGETEALKKFLTENTDQTVKDAIRDAVGGFELPQIAGAPQQRFEGFSLGGQQRPDILTHRDLLEGKIRLCLRNQRESIFVQTGILNPWEPGTVNGGPGAQAFDIAVVKVTPTDVNVKTQMNALAGAQREAQATRAREEGWTSALNDRKTKLGVSGRDALGHDAIIRGKANVNVVTNSLTKILGGLFGGGGRRNP